MKLDTFFSISRQTLIFLLSVILGAVLGVLYDCFRVLRVLFPPAAKPKAVFIGDVLFWLIYGFCVFCYGAVFARGQVRLFIIFGSLIGFALYLLTVGSVVIGVIRCAAEAVRKILLKVYSGTIEPFVKLLRIFCQKITQFFVGNHKNDNKSAGSIKKVLKNTVSMVYNKKAVLYIPSPKGKRESRGKRKTMEAAADKGYPTETAEGGGLPEGGAH